MTDGTPKTLKQAILNGLYDYYGEGSDYSGLEVTMEKHIKDFLAQKFLVALNARDKQVHTVVDELWVKVTKEEM